MSVRSGGVRENTWGRWLDCLWAEVFPHLSSFEISKIYFESEDSHMKWKMFSLLGKTHKENTSMSNPLSVTLPSPCGQPRSDVAPLGWMPVALSASNEIIIMHYTTFSFLSLAAERAWWAVTNNTFFPVFSNYSLYLEFHVYKSRNGAS